MAPFEGALPVSEDNLSLAPSSCVIQVLSACGDSELEGVVIYYVVVTANLTFVIGALV